MHRTPAYEQAAGLADSRFVVADADFPEVVDQVLAADLLAQTVFVGAHAPAGAAAWMMRPIDALHVLRELDLLVSRQGLASATTMEPYALPKAPPPSADALAAPAPPDGTERRGRRPPRGAARDALLIDDSEIALRLLEVKLQRLGLATRKAFNSQQALRQLADGAPAFVFVDVDLGPGSEIDGLALCQRIRRLPPRAGDEMPVIVLVSANHSEIDRVRGALAGCDGFLGKPLDDAAIGGVLALRERRGADLRSPLPG
jgi:CheY-like chemotaxis protein